MAIEECKTMVETLNHDILGYSTLFSEELQWIDWLTHRGNESSFECMEICKAESCLQCTRGVSKASVGWWLYTGVARSCYRTFFGDYHNPLWNTLFTNKYNLTTAGFEQCSFHFGDSHSLMFTNLPTSSESNTGLTWQWWLASRCRSVTASESAIGASLEVSRSLEIRLQHARYDYIFNQCHIL